jgi:hypothetical protein
MPQTATCGARIVDVLDRNFLTLLSLVLVGYVLFFVPQVFAIWWEMPTQFFSQPDVGWLGLAFIVYVFGAFAFYGLAWVVIRSDRMRARLRRLDRYGLARVRHAVEWARWLLGGWLVERAARMTDRGRTITAVALAALGAALWLLPSAWPALGAPWPLAGMVGAIPVLLVLTASWLLLLCGWWVAAVHGFPAWRRAVVGLAAVALAVLVEVALSVSDRPGGGWRPIVHGIVSPFLLGIAGLGIVLAVEGGSGLPTGDRPFRGFTGLLGRFLVLALMTGLIGEVVWVLAHALPVFVSYRVYTIGAVFYICFLIVGVAAVLDMWHEDWRWPARQATFAAIALVTLTTWFLTPDPVGESLAEPPARDWYDALLARMKATAAPDDPVVVVAASGGGSRAAYFTALVYEALKEQPWPGADGQSPPVWERGPGDDPHPSWADQVILISSVSGGSLATAYYVNAPHTPLWPDPNDLQQSFGGALERAATQLGSDPASNSLTRIYEDSWKALMDPPGDRTPAARTAIGRRAQVGLTTYPWMVRSRMADDLCTDYMAPLLRGFMAPGVRRGVALSRFWEDRFGWQRCDNLGGFGDRGYGEGATPPPPLVLFNATNTLWGTRLVVGFPPLERGLFNQHPGDPAPTDLLPDGKEFHTLALADFDPGYRVHLAEAVRLSANFPWGYRSARLSSAKSPWGALNLLDGGVNDNTGIGTLGDVFERLDQVSGSKPAGPAAKKARQVLAELRRRGVVLVEIDSGAKPSVAPTIELKTPAQGLENAGYANAFADKKAALKRLDEVLRPANRKAWAKATNSEDPHLPHLWWNPFVCNHQRYEAMTAWSLPPSDKATILATFFWEYRDWTEVKLQGEFPRWFRAWKAQAADHPAPAAPPSVEPPGQPPAAWTSQAAQNQYRRELFMKK